MRQSVLRVLERLPVMAEADLVALATNANARLSQPELKEDSERVMAAIAEERERRKTAARDATEAARAAIRERMVSLTLNERVSVAFRERPPVSWEVAAIRAIAENGGSTTEQLSGALGYSGGYMNMAFGTLCHDRQAWLGAPPKSMRGDGVVYSALLIDFREQQDFAAGRRWTEWWLKPDAMSGLEVAGVI